MSPRFYTCRYTPAGGRMCLAPTGNGLHCQKHAIMAVVDKAHEKALLERPIEPTPPAPENNLARKGHWPFWPK